MKKICYLFDIDLIERSTRPHFPKLPNHAITKFSAYFKKKGYTIKLVYHPSLIPLSYESHNKYIGSALYTPNLNRFKKRLILREQKYNQYDALKIDQIKIGTPTDYCPITDLPGLKSDYTEYDAMLKNTDIKLDWYPDSVGNVGFLTRHCIRQCDFCINRDRKEILRVNNLEDIYINKGRPIELLDDNLFAYKDSDKLFYEIADFYNKHKVEIKLRNGLDLRSAPQKKVKALQKAQKAFKTFHCAWDDVKNTFIYKNINIVNNAIKLPLYCYLITGVNVNNKQDLKKDLLAFFYRYYLLQYIRVRGVIQVYEDDTQKYINPYFKHYKIIKMNYAFMKNGSQVHLTRNLHGKQLELANEIIDVLDEFSWIVEDKWGDIIYNPNFNKKMEEIAKFLEIKHYPPQYNR